MTALQTDSDAPDVTLGSPKDSRRNQPRIPGSSKAAPDRDFKGGPLSRHARIVARADVPELPCGRGPARFDPITVSHWEARSRRPAHQTLRPPSITMFCPVM